MSGRYVRLGPGRYTLDVAEGAGPAGVRREAGDGDVSLDIAGGRAAFRVAEPEQVYYWWRGPAERPGVRLLGARGPETDRRPAARRPARTAG